MDVLHQTLIVYFHNTLIVQWYFLYCVCNNYIPVTCWCFLEIHIVESWCNQFQPRYVFVNSVAVSLKHQTDVGP